MKIINIVYYTVNFAQRTIHIGVYGPIFSRGAEPSLPENFLDSARKKTAAQTCKITLPNSPHGSHPIIINKIPDFGHFIWLDGMNYSVFYR